MKKAAVLPSSSWVFLPDCYSQELQEQPFLKMLNMLTQEIGDEAVIETLVDLKPVFTPENDPFVQIVYDVSKLVRVSLRWPTRLMSFAILTNWSRL